MDGWAGSVFLPSTGTSLLMSFSTLYLFAIVSRISLYPMAGGSFWLEVLGYEINPAKYRDCAAAREREGFIP